MNPKDIIEEINDTYTTLNSWEKQFMESITDQFERKGSLSEGQLEKLIQIYEKNH